MRTFSCPTCGQMVFFENFSCLNCGTQLGYSRADRTLVASTLRCINAETASCNWLPDGGPMCGSCALTRTRPANTDITGLAAYARVEAAKRRLVQQLDELGLTTQGVAFDLLSSAEQPVTTGHADGVITIDLAEGDDRHREAMRVQLAEPYRTLLGHLRHEIGHWYWTVLIEPDPEPFRSLFGDERADYALALDQHYHGPPPPGWAEFAVSTYATAHPWEDWAETFAHYLHIRDTLDTAGAFGLVVEGPTAVADVSLAADPTEKPRSFDELIDTWLPLTYALNAVNRSMGKDDLYPFYLSATVLDKLRFVHHAVTG